MIYLREKMIFKQIESDRDRNFVCLIVCKKTKEGALADPSPDPIKVMKIANQCHGDV